MTLKELLYISDSKLNVRVLLSKPDKYGYTELYGSMSVLLISLHLHECANWQVTKISFKTHDRHGFLVENGIMVVNVDALQ